MIHILLSLQLLLGTAVFGADAGAVDVVNSREPVEWLGEVTVDVGDIPQGEDFQYTFQYRNTSSDSLWVDNVRVGCGCTATEWADTAVAPGETGSINVTFDAMNGGYFRKYVKVYFVDHRGGHRLWLTGFVE